MRGDQDAATWGTKPVFFVTLPFIAWLALLPVAASAQGAEGGLHGEARIASQARVRLALSAGEGTRAARAARLGQRVAARMTAVRACYERTVAQDPTVVGVLQLDLRLGARGPLRVSARPDGLPDPALVRCVTRRLRSVDCAGLHRPTAAVVELTFEHSAARGAAVSAARARTVQRIRVAAGPDGRPRSSGGTADGSVRFSVAGSAGEEASVDATHRGLLRALPRLRDCRRRAQWRDGQEGQPMPPIRLRARVRQDRVVEVRRRDRSEDPTRAERCALRAVGRASIGRSPLGGPAVRVDIELQFAAAPAAP